MLSGWKTLFTASGVNSAVLAFLTLSYRWKLGHRVQPFISTVASTAWLARQEGAGRKQESVVRASLPIRWSWPEQSSLCVMQLPAQSLLQREKRVSKYDYKELYSTTVEQQVFRPETWHKTDCISRDNLGIYYPRADGRLDISLQYCFRVLQVHSKGST